LPPLINTLSVLNIGHKFLFVALISVNYYVNLKFANNLIQNSKGSFTPFSFVCLRFHVKVYPANRTVEAPSSRIVIIEGIYALSEKLRTLLDLRVSVTGGVHLDLVKRVIRDIQRAGQEPEEIIYQISETVLIIRFII
jgi:uridine kinase